MWVRAAFCHRKPGAPHEKQNQEIVLRLGFRYVRKLREESAKAIAAARQRAGFEDIPDFTRRVPGLRRDELQNLAACGALNPLDHRSQLHRRDALWQVAKFGMPTGPLFQDIPDYDPTSILLRMTDMERLIVDHHISGFTIGRHAIAYRREDLKSHEAGHALRSQKQPRRRICEDGRRSHRDAETGNGERNHVYDVAR
jgi:error-prone DNA polymerase